MKVETVLLAQLCLTLWNPMDYSSPDSSVPGISQARIVDGWPFPSPGDLPNPGIQPGSLSLQIVSLPSGPPGEPHFGGWGFTADPTAESSQ